ncbi:GMC family oxidoreductase [Aspergillus mulundensis]|uniref:Glucose-methanol-choline oxidoreductase N-terminal domain-containing protein n=1 Tax=Aspergillus mulundensis TaxID=1810919 RepID=A0A3D8Q9W9_9EURO|nr:Uncharacterized protein DSM5745_11262 [Aspergillus mulundensis]RDW58571.1 Uncharacterized protein DSM5745_11262 [Aspergillus mulundensis]
MASEYEYIIVGSGAGGGPLAANLARHGYRVLLLEAGDDQGENLHTQIPAFHTISSEDPAIRWDFFVQHYDDEQQAARDPKMTWTTPEVSKQNGIYYPRAATIGGCTMHNAMMTFLPPDEDWGHIAKLTADHSWAPKEMRKYFERVERCGYLESGTAGHGFNGYLETSHPDPGLLESMKPFLEAALDTAPSKENGSPPQAIRDANAPESHGTEGVVKMVLAMTKHGRRSSPREYLISTANATNSDGSKRYPLTISTHSFATKVLLGNKGATPKATGVEFLCGAGLYEAAPMYDPKTTARTKREFATREVIVAGGAFNTPQLLKLSGIGPKDELQKFRIPVVVDLPGVGTNLQDNYETHVLSRSPKNISVLANSLLGAAGDPFLRQWVTKGSGPFKSNGEALGVKKKSTTSSEACHDLFLFGGPISFTGFFPGYSKAFSTTFDKFCWNVLKVHPRNERVGTVTLRSSDPRQRPAIDFRFLDARNDADHDLGVMAEGVTIARKMFANNKISEAFGQQEEENPGPAAQSSDAVKQDIKDKAFSHHATSTCAIGADDDQLACLDSNFNVRGVKGLRVVDASVFPRVPGAYPVLPIYMISEKATDVILEAAKQPASEVMPIL